MNIPTIGNVEAVLFDMDGLLFNSEALYRKAIVKMGKVRSAKFTQDMHREMMGRSSNDSMAVVKREWELDDAIGDLIDERDELVIEIAKKGIKIMPGVQDLVQFCIDREIEHATVTGSNKRVAEAFMKVSELNNGFKFILDGDQVESGKPAPDIYLKAAKKIKAEPGKCLVFEDSLNGVKSANAAGCKVIACPNEYSLDQDFSISDRRVDSLAEIVPYINMF